MLQTLFDSLPWHLLFQSCLALAHLQHLQPFTTFTLVTALNKPL